VTARTAVVRIVMHNGDSYQLTEVPIFEAAKVIADVADGANICMAASCAVTDRREGADGKDMGAGMVSIARADIAQISLVVKL
jgi:hypothetical protein